MKKILSAILCAATAVAASATESVRWLETTHNFGAFNEEMGPVSATFRFVNTGDEPVGIVAARASCGCTAPKYSREGIAPGDTATITVTYDPAGRPGRFSKYVAVDLSFVDSRQKLIVEGTVVGTPASLSQQYPVECAGAMRLARNAALMGNITKGELKTFFLKAYNGGTDSIAPVVSGAPSYITVNVAPEKVGPGEQCSFIFYFDSSKCPEYGLVRDTVQVSAAPDAGCQLPVTAIVAEDFTKMSEKARAKAPVLKIDADRLDFGTFKTGDSRLSRTMTIENTGHSVLELRRVYTIAQGVQVACDKTRIKPGHKAEVTVTVDPSALTGTVLNARISIIANDPLNPVQTFRAVGEVR